MSEHERAHDRPESGERAESAAAESSPLERLASSVGNRAFGMLARDGAGIVPGGRAHPDVEAAIGRARGGGRALDGSLRERLGAPLGDPLADVRVHDDAHADTLARSVSARAFAVGSDVFFARGEYSPGSSAGDRLIAHEVTHVVQQRGAPSSGPLSVSDPGDAMEREADAVSDEFVP
jgi:hypothetical protein